MTPKPHDPATIALFARLAPRVERAHLAALDACEVVPTDGVATLASHWCLTHDAPGDHS